MQNFIFHPGPRLVSGAGSATRLAEHLPDGPCLFVTDREVVALGLTDACRATLGEVIVFDTVEPDPSKETLLAAVEAGRAAGATSVVGFGGGSPMDVAKLAAYLLGSGDDVDAIWGVGLATGRHLPRALTAATGIDAIVHAIEAFTSARTKNPLSDLYAIEALRLLSTNLLTACAAPTDLAARSAMLFGAPLAGLAFANAPVAGVHALAYPLGGLHHLPHGLSNALMLRHVLQHNQEAAREEYATLAHVLEPGCAGQGSQMQCALFIDRLAALVIASGLAPRLRDHGISQADIPTLAREAMKQQRLLVNNPCAIDEADARRLYEAAW